MSAMNWWMNMLVWLQKMSKGKQGHVTWRHLSSGFKTVRLRSVLLLSNTIVSVSAIWNVRMIIEVPSRRLKYQISRLAVLCRETGSVSDRNTSGRPTVLNDVSVENIRHYLVQS